jgi:glucan 1,3-beta-glucosidase
MWADRHISGRFIGSKFLLAQCPTSAAVSPAHEAAYMSMHIMTTASHVYLKNYWLQIADHNSDDPSGTRMSISIQAIVFLLREIRFAVS